MYPPPLDARLGSNKYKGRSKFTYPFTPISNTFDELLYTKILIGRVVDSILNLPDGSGAWNIV